MKIRNFVIAVALSLSLAGVVSQVQAADYAIVLKTLSNPFWVSMKDGIEKEAQKLGGARHISAAPSESELQAHLVLFEDGLNKNYKGIAFAPISAVNLVQPAAKAYKKGVFLVNLDEKVDGASLKQAGGNVEAFITTDNGAVGKKGADFIVQQLGATGGKVAIVEGKAGAASGEARKKGATEGFQSAKNIQLVASQPA